MICLSKHKMDIKVCSICGSMKQNTKKKSTAPATPHASTLKTISSNLYPPSYLKTWACSFCSFANDSLKIVCMNCRCSKQQQSQQKAKKDQVLLHQSIQTKRARRELEAKKVLNTSNEENELIEENATRRNVKKSKKEEQLVEIETKTCTCKCIKSDVKLDQVITTTKAQSVVSAFANSIIPNHSKLVTPTKPSNFYDNSNNSSSQQGETSTLSKLINATDNNKWSCSVCLVKNDDDKNVCACCMSAREVQVSSKKWTCSVCLVSNEANKNTCVCCMTSRSKENNQVVAKNETKTKNVNDVANYETSKTKFSELVAAANSLNLLKNSASRNISFGLQPNETIKPIQFDSSFSMNQSCASGFSFAGSSSLSKVSIEKNDEKKYDLIKTTTNAKR